MVFLVRTFGVRNVQTTHQRILSHALVANGGETPRENKEREEFHKRKRPRKAAGTSETKARGGVGESVEGEIDEQNERR